jgi:hypothetical protein
MAIGTTHLSQNWEIRTETRHLLVIFDSLMLRYRIRLINYGKRGAGTQENATISLEAVPREVQNCPMIGGFVMSILDQGHNLGSAVFILTHGGQTEPSEDYQVEVIFNKLKEEVTNGN